MYIITKNLSEAFGLQWSVADFIMERHLRWLGHFGHMSDDRVPMQLLFGELQRTQPFHRTKKRWHDSVLSDLKAISIDNCWYSLCQDWMQWNKNYVILQFGEWHIPEDITAVLLTCPHKG